jgi:hypothetical protein
VSTIVSTKFKRESELGLFKSGLSKFSLSEKNTDDHRIYNSHDDRRYIKVESIKLDGYFRSYDGKIDFIKMDVQGAEGLVLKGMVKLLKMKRCKKIYTEFWPIGLKRSGIEAKEFLDLLIKHDFELYHVNEDEKKIEPVHISRLLEMYSAEKENFTNLYCIKSVRSSDVGGA